jgi:hypothetical protein
LSFPKIQSIAHLSRRGGDADPDKVDIDAMFASIVAGFHGDEQQPSAPTRPAPEDLPKRDLGPRRRRTDPRPEPGAQPQDGGPQPVFEPSLLDGLDRFGAHLPDDEEDGFTPPPPPPLPRLSRATVAALLAVVGGLVLFLWPQVLPIQPNVALLLGFSGVLGGFIALVWRLRPDEDDDDPDDGARV